MSDLGTAAVIVAAAIAIGVVLARAVPARSAQRRARRAGVNLTSTAALADLARLESLAFDKHRTIATGELAVVSVNPARPDADRDLRWFAGALEHHAGDPVGRAIARLSSAGHVTEVEQVDGEGIRGAVDRHPVRVGSPSWLGVEVVGTIGTTVAVEVDARFMGSITVADEIAPEAGTELGLLRSAGISPILLSGDDPVTAKDLATRAGIDHVMPVGTELERAQAEQRLSAEDPRRGVLDPTSTSFQLAGTTCTLDPACRPLAALASAVTAARDVPSTTRRSTVVAVAVPLVGLPLAFSPLGWVASLVMSGLGLVAVAVTATRR